jgi:hypothetical protein
MSALAAEVRQGPEAARCHLAAKAKATPADVVYRYPQFYWNNVAAHLTSRGRQWVANLYGNVFRAERELNLSGPQS